MLVMFVFLRGVTPVTSLIHAALFSANFLSATGVLTHMWSLSLEEQFYVFLPLLLIVLIRFDKSLSSLPWVFLAIAVLCFAFRVADPGGYTQFHLRIDNLFTGVILRYAVDFRPNWFQLVARYSLIPAMLFWLPAVLLLMFTSNLAHSLMYTGIDVGCGCLVAWCYAHDTQKFWSWAPFKFLASIGVYSYSIYLWQQPIAAIAANKFRPLTAGILGFPVSILLGILMFKLIEQPSIRFRDKLTSARDQAVHSKPAESSSPSPRPLGEDV